MVKLRYSQTPLAMHIPWKCPSRQSTQIHHTHSLGNMTIKKLDIFGLLNEFDIDKSTGLRELHSMLLKELANFVENPFGNLSVTEGRLSEVLKNVIVSHVFKTGTKLFLI